VRSGTGAARTILLFHTNSAKPSEQPRMVGSTLGVYSFGLIFVSARTNTRLMIIINYNETVLELHCPIPIHKKDQTVLELHCTIPIHKKDQM